MIVHIDIETRSALPLAQVSTERYAGDPSTEVLVVAYAVDDGPIETWVPGEPVPDAITGEDSFAAHNAHFEFAIINNLLAPRHGWPRIPIECFTCTMAMTRASALPGSLDGAAAALGLETRKDKAGAKLMREIASRQREPTPEDLERLGDYCRQDVAVERELHHRLPPLTESEQALWRLDHEINGRGIPIDRRLAIAVAELAKQQRIAINAEIEALTGGKVTTANQRDRILAWITADGYVIDSLTKAEVTKALANGVGDGVRKLLELRAIGSQAAAGKVKTLLVGLDDDDRLRGTLLYHGSATGRWSGRKFQPQNLRKPAKTLDIDAAIAAVKNGALADIAKLGQPLSIAADVSRGLICARPGHVLIGADFSAVESRVLAWLADDKRKLATYRAFDETGDPTLEPYCVTASKILGRTVTPADTEGRTIGKTADLALGFGGSVGAWRKLAPNDTRTDDEIKANVASWRSAHPKITRFWNELENALKRAVRRPGKRFTCGRLVAECRDGTLWMTLPSGRSIAYPEARLVDGKFEDTVDIAFKDNAKGQWREVTEWYGTFVENAVQATARDLLAAALMRLEAAGFPIVAHVHDEAVAEIPNGADRQAEFLAVMTETPPWADGLPIAGKAWCGQRFVKSDKPTAGNPTQTDDASAPAEQESAPMLDHDQPPWEDHDEEEASPCEEEAPKPHNTYTTRDADSVKPYAPVRARLIERGYKLAKSFPFVLPGEAEPLFFEDRYEKPGKDDWAKKDKECRFRHIKDGVELCDTGPRRILYGLPGLVKAALSTPVFITEGAAKCDPLIAAGLVAVAAPYHTFKDECATALAGRTLIYFEDHDRPDKDGRIAAKEFSERARQQLSGLAASFQIMPAIVLFRSLGISGQPPHGWDVKDWLAAGGEVARLYELLRNAEPWGEAVDPVDLWGHFDPPPLPGGLLPDVIEEFAREEADTMGADPAGLVMAALTVCAAALPDRVKLQVKKHNPHWKESARLWVAGVGGVSSKKTPVIGRVTTALRKLDWELVRQHETEMEVYDQLTKEERKKHKPPVAVRLVIEDTTIEAMQEAVKGNPDGIMKVHDELAAFFGAMERYNSGASGSNRAFYLQAYNGGPYIIDRVGRGAIRFENLSMCVLGGIQPEAMRKIATDSIEDGLIQRIIPVMLRSAEAGKDIPRGQAGERYDRLVARLHETGIPPEPPQFDDAARAVRERLAREHMRLQQYYEGFNRRLAAHIGKYDGLFARLCLLWHCIEGASTPLVTDRTAQRVGDFMHRFMLPHALAFYTSVLGVSDSYDSVSQVAGYILAKKLTRITSRDIQRSTGGPNGLERREVEGICDSLESLGWLYRVQGPRRDSAHWDVNLEVHRRFAERAAREVKERAARQSAIMEAAERRAQKEEQ
jgi:hypothetical protein